MLKSPLVAVNNTLDRLLWSRLFAADRPQLSPELKQQLIAYYAQDAKCLERWLGKKLTGWSDLTDFKPEMIGNSSKL